QTFASIGLIAALYSAAAYQPRSRQRLVAALTAGYMLLAWAEHTAGSPAAPQEFVVFYLCLAACWLFGSWARGQRQRQAGVRRLSSRPTWGKSPRWWSRPAPRVNRSSSRHGAGCRRWARDATWPRTGWSRRR